METMNIRIMIQNTIATTVPGSRPESELPTLEPVFAIVDELPMLETL
jgi:hypothetical protein